MRELSRLECEEEATRLNLKICKKYDHSIEKIVFLQKTLSCQQEGFVVKFGNGLRVKFKTEEYVRMNKILNSMNIKTVWESMENGKIPDGYMMTVPEEIREEAEKFKTELESAYVKILDESLREVNIWLPVFPKNDKDKEAYKTIALFMKDNASKFKYPMLVFPWVRGKYADIGRIIKEMIRPKLGE